MQRNARGTNRSVLPIFGNRKRQRQAIFADSIDLSNSNDDGLFNDMSNDNFSAQNAYKNQEHCNMQSDRSAGMNLIEDSYHLNSSSSRNSGFNSYAPNRYQGRTERNQNTFDNNIHNESLSNSMFDDSFCENSLLNSTANRGRNFQNKSVMNNSYSQGRDVHNQMNRSSIQSQRQSNSKNFSSQNQRCNGNQMRMNNSNNTRNNFTNQNGLMNSNKRSSGRNGDQTCPLGMLPPPSKFQKAPSRKHSDAIRNRTTHQQQSHHVERGRTNQHQQPSSSSSSHTESRRPINKQDGMSRDNNQLDAVVPQLKVKNSSARNSSHNSSNSNTSTTNNTTTKKQSNPAPKVITTTISKLERWSKVDDDSPKVFEICGNLSSAVSQNNKNMAAEKMFTISDGTGEIRCLFWEIDRRLPILSRGSTVRCVGRVNQGYFHSLCIRNVKPREVQLIKKLVDKSDILLQTANVIGRTS